MGVACRDSHTRGVARACSCAPARPPAARRRGRQLVTRAPLAAPWRFNSERGGLRGGWRRAGARAAPTSSALPCSTIPRAGAVRPRPPRPAQTHLQRL